MNQRGPNRRTQTATKETTTKVTRPSRCCADVATPNAAPTVAATGTPAIVRTVADRVGSLTRVETSMATIAPSSTRQGRGRPEQSRVEQLDQHRRADSEHRLQRLPESAEPGIGGNQPVTGVAQGRPEPGRSHLGQHPGPACNGGGLHGCRSFQTSPETVRQDVPATPTSAGRRREAVLAGVIAPAAPARPPSSGC